MAKELLNNWSLLVRCRFEMNGEAFRISRYFPRSIELEFDSGRTEKLHRAAFLNLLATRAIEITEAPNRG